MGALVTWPALRAFLADRGADRGSSSFVLSASLAGFACRYSPGHGMNVLDRFHPADPAHHRIALASIRRTLLEQPDAVGWIGDADGGLEFYRLAVPDETTDGEPLPDCIGTLLPFPGSRPRRMVAVKEVVA